MSNDNSNELIAAAYEAAAHKVWLDYYETAEEAAEQIRDLTPSDAHVAYDAAIRAAKIEGMREAKASAENAFKKLLPTAAFWIVLCDDAITALIKETEKGGDGGLG